MIGLIRIWNYVFYLTWKLLNKIGVNFIQKPLLKFLYFVFPALSKKQDEIEKSSISTMVDVDKGFNLGFAFVLMFSATTLIYAIICIYTIGQLDSNVDGNLQYYFIGILSLAYLTNYLLLWHSDNYKKYFKEFNRVTIAKTNYLYVVLFHFGVTVFFVLIIFWIVGFNL